MRFRHFTISLLLMLLVLCPELGAQEANAPGKEKIQVFILSGQSNMDGRGKLEGLTEEQLELIKPEEEVLYYFHLMPGLDYAEVYGPGWHPLQIFVNRWGKKQFGPEMTFGKTLHQKRPNQKIAILKLSQGGASLFRDFSPIINEHEKKGYHLYPWMIRKANRAIGMLEQQGYDPEIAAFIWVQGWTDAYVKEGSDTYAKNLPQLFEYVRRDFNNPKLPIVFSQVHPNIDVKFTGPVLEAQAATARADPNAAMISSTDLTLLEDGAHFTPESYFTLGTNLANEYLNLKTIQEKRAKEEAAALKKAEEKAKAEAAKAEAAK